MDDPSSIIPKLQDVAGWVSCAWNQVKEETITNAWRHIGLNSSVEINWNDEQGENGTLFDDVEFGNATEETLHAVEFLPEEAVE